MVCAMAGRGQMGVCQSARACRDRVHLYMLVLCLNCLRGRRGMEMVSPVGLYAHDACEPRVNMVCPLMFVPVRECSARCSCLCCVL